MKTLILLVLVFTSTCISAAEPTFPLGKPLPDKAIVCLTKDAAVSIAESAERQVVGEMVIGILMNEGLCFHITGMMTYTAQVHETKKHFYVYQMTFGKLTGFVPTNMKSDGTDI